MRVSRTCTEIPARDEDRHQRGESQSRPLKEFRESPAYVLVGDPGAGKTTSFQDECAALGEQAFLVTARDFLTFDPQNHPEWRGRTLFIDGLDEIRAGTSDVLTPFHQIRSKLDALVKPRFRLSCREADWLGENDRKHLESVSPDSSVTVLRLDPLTNAEVALILSARGDIQDAEAFIKTAEERGVGGLLENPQTLEMLADIVRAGEGWPESRMQTFEMACRQMVREHNDENAAAQEPDGPPAPDQLLDAAGRLCALQLISGGSGYTLRGQPEEEYPALDQCDYDRQVLRLALATKLFKGASSNRFAPVHRHIAEFLGARHVAGAIENGLPGRRVIALMEGEDGTVVTEMRGLSAWLAAQSPQARADLIERDPIGVGLYGDVGEFSLDEKRALLGALQREGIRLVSLWSSAAAFSALATPALEAELREILQDGDRSPDHQAFTNFVLRVLSEGTPLADLGMLLLEIVRGRRRWPSVNTSALNAFRHNCSDTGAKADLKPLLDDIRVGRVSDPDRELLGTLLTELYPQELPPSEIWEYLSEQGYPELYGRYRRFWDTRLIEQSSAEQMAELLDRLHRRLPRLRTALDARHLSALPLKLLALGLEIHGAHLEPERLYDWLSVGLLWDKDPQTSWFGAEPIGRIRDWLEQHPGSRKAVYAEGMHRSIGSDEFQSFSFNVRKRLYGASPPPDFGLWSLEQAVAMSDSHPDIADELLRWAVRADTDQRDNEGLSLDVLQEYSGAKERLHANLNRLLSPLPNPQPRLECPRKDSPITEERQQKREEQLAYLRSKEAALLENRAPPELLHWIARDYIRSFFDYGAGEGPRAIAQSLHGDGRLIDAALRGLRGTIDRADLPEVNEILRLRENNRMHHLSLPFLAGLAEVERTAPEDAAQWDDSRIHRAIAFYYSTPHGEYRPRWYQRLLEARPEIVAETQVQLAVCEFRSGREHIYKLAELAQDPLHAGVAKLATMPLLRAFPTRCNLKQIDLLHHLLKAGIEHADPRSLGELIDTKLSRKSMNDAQRLSWLTAGVVIAPEMYSDSLTDFVKGKEHRIWQVVRFFFNDSDVRPSLSGIADPLSGLLIRLVGSNVEPDEHRSEANFVTAEMQASFLVHGLIRGLAASPAKEATSALGRLFEDEALANWHNVLSDAQDKQRVIRRDATYHHPDIAQVCRTLNGGTPANAADLSSLLMDLLVDLARDIRKGNTNDWRQYWNVDSHGRPVDPRPEESCRETLLSALRQRLPQGVDAQPEGQYANKKRADIRVSCGDFQVPVEIKKNRHLKLWSALRDQLIAKYTTDPATGGYGIYLVFWFGREHTQPPPSGGRPAGPEELSERLAAEANLSAVEARKISICVVDVSRPDG